MVKKIVILFTMAVMLVSLAACGKKQGGVDNAGDGKKIKIAYLPITHSLAVLEEADELQEKDQAWQALLEMCGDGTLLTNIGTSMYRFLAGYISSVMVAVFFGLALDAFYRSVVVLCCFRKREGGRKFAGVFGTGSAPGMACGRMY